MWISPDPILGEYLPNRLDKAQLESDFVAERDLIGMGGIFAPLNLGLYTYSHQNPIKYLDLDGNSTSPTPGRITSPFAERQDPFTGEAVKHEAVDIANRNTGHVAARNSGVVINATQGKQDNKDAPNTVTIMYDKGEDGQQYGVYVHVKSPLSRGDRVKEGQSIGVTDQSGRSTGPHLHYQLRDETGSPIDPSPFMANDNPYPSELIE